VRNVQARWGAGDRGFWMLAALLAEESAAGNRIQMLEQHPIVCVSICRYRRLTCS
jgi:hypothetical protein